MDDIYFRQNLIYLFLKVFVGTNNSDLLTEMRTYFIANTQPRMLKVN